jgi:hypothetical protein
MLALGDRALHRARVVLGLREMVAAPCTYGSNIPAAPDRVLVTCRRA